MKFSLYMTAHLTPEWQTQYVNYEDMKAILYKCEQEANTEQTEEDKERYYISADETFFQYCGKELAKINIFYDEKISEAKRKFETLKGELETSLESLDMSQSKRKAANKRHNLKMAFSELYLLLILIQNYQQLNYTGFQKILKKHDKVFCTSRGGDWLRASVESAPFYTNKDTTAMIEAVEQLFTEKLEAGDRRRAMDRLRVPPLEQKQNPGTTFRLGLLVGMIAVLLPCCFVLIALLGNYPAFVPWKPAFLLYRPFFVFILHAILIGVNVYGWSVAGVNHVLIFEIDPRQHSSYQDLIEVSSFVGVIYMLSICSFIITYHYRFYPWINPLLFMIFLLLFLFNPTNTFNHEARFWMLKRMARLITAPACCVHFADFWLGDQLISLTIPFADCQYIVLFYYRCYNWTDHSWTDVDCTTSIVINAVLVSLPSWFRFMQCMRRCIDSRLLYPHLPNAAKYATTFMVATSAALFSVHIHSYDRLKVNPYLYLYVVCLLIESTLKSYWDIRIDWGLFQNTTKHHCLRKQTVYSSEMYYYAAIAQNIIIRYMWPVELYVLTGFGRQYYQSYKFAMSIAEVFRRHIWNYLRLENEHLNNVGMFRAVRDISIMPIKPNSSQFLETLMDDEDGVHNRGSSNGSASNTMSSRPRDAFNDFLRHTANIRQHITRRHRS